MNRFVLDCSITMSWCLQDEANEVADVVLASLEVQKAVAPSHWLLEVANVLTLCERRRRVTDARIVEFLGFLGTLPIAIDDQTAKHALGDVLALARTHRLTAYGAAYLELALREGCPLASLDATLNDAASGLGIALFAG
jgi:predicted nucleic acid-binding protein